MPRRRHVGSLWAKYICPSNSLCAKPKEKDTDIIITLASKLTIGRGKKNGVNKRKRKEVLGPGTNLAKFRQEAKTWLLGLEAKYMQGCAERGVLTLAALSLLDFVAISQRQHLQASENNVHHDYDPESVKLVSGLKVVHRKDEVVRLSFFFCDPRDDSLQRPVRRRDRKKPTKVDWCAFPGDNHSVEEHEEHQERSSKH
mmetsp:Transcript_52879/g.115615  ORF Transcript_52879/g.115615 Transcript_52879/m.115615 type:complete len:199 (+) Transcript_52879:289-885(+)